MSTDRGHRLRRTRGPTAVLVALLLLTACGSGGGATPTAAPAPTGSAAFPLTVEHSRGSTTVPSAPQRVVTVGVTEQDTVLALGIVPVGVTEWYGDQPDATWPWAHDALGGAHPTVLSSRDGINVEAVAGLTPDLIIGTNAGLGQSDYDSLSAVAPTIAGVPGGPQLFAAWDRQAVLIGTALGQREKAQQLVDDLEGRFADAAAAHPEFAGTAAVFLQAPYYDGEAVAYQDGLSTDFLTDLGFVVPTEINTFAPDDGSGQAYIPLENLSVLEAADVLLWATEDDDARSALEAEPVYRALTPVQRGHLAFTDATLAGAVYFTSLLSLPLVLDELVPRLAAAVAGDPATVPAS